MKIRVHFKTPDAVDYALKDAGLDADALEDAKVGLAKWVQWGECILIEFDLEARTAEVIPAKPLGF